MNAPLHGPQETRFYPVVNVAQTGSTNSDVTAEARCGTSEGFTLIADYQTDGRGRFDRSWFATKGDSLLLSTLLRPRLELVPITPLLVGLAVQEAIQRLATQLDPAMVGLKWPNDIVLLDRSEAKVAGILVESTVDGQAVAVVVGIGINIKFSTLPPESIAKRAVCLTDIGQRNLKRQEVLNVVLQSLERWLVRVEDAGLDAIVENYEARCMTIGRNVTFSDPNGVETTGRATGVDPAGGLLVKTTSGLRTVLSSDIFHIGLTT